MKKKEYKISVIIPVYNVEKYLEETIESVVNQTIGFDNIQMILVILQKNVRWQTTISNINLPWMKMET